MWKIDGYVAPAMRYGALAIDDILSFGDSVDEYKEADNVYIPDEYYDYPDKDGVTACDYIYGSQTSDETEYLSNALRELPSSTEAYAGICKPPKGQRTAVLAIDECPLAVDPALVVEKSKPPVYVRKYYLAQCTNCKELAEQIPYVFRNLLFAPNALVEIHKTVGAKGSTDEVLRHLFVLDQYAKGLYLEKHDGKYAVDALRAHNLLCSGAGSNETNHKIDFKHNGVTYPLTCNPHTKLFRADSDARIYFCWGRSEIDDHNVIIVKVGGHW